MDVPVSRLKFPAERLRRVQPQLSILVQKLHQGFTVDEVHLARTCRFRRHFVGCSGNYRTQAQRLARFGHLEDEDFAIARSGREFYFA